MTCISTLIEQLSPIADRLSWDVQSFLLIIVVPQGGPSGAIGHPHSTCTLLALYLRSCRSGSRPSILPARLPSLRVKVETNGFHSAYKAVVFAMYMQSGNIIKPTLFWWFWWSSRVDFKDMFASLLPSKSFRNSWRLQRCTHGYQINNIFPAWNGRSHLCTDRKRAFIADSPSHFSLWHHS